MSLLSCRGARLCEHIFCFRFADCGIPRKVMREIRLRSKNVHQFYQLLRVDSFLHAEIFRTDGLAIRTRARNRQGEFHTWLNIDGGQLTHGVAAFRLSDDRVFSRPYESGAQTTVAHREEGDVNPHTPGEATSHALFF